MAKHHQVNGLIKFLINCYMLLQILAEILTADNGLSLTGSYPTVSFSESESSQH
jgi:hypothetical protein